MNDVIAPLKPGMHGQTVADRQDALQFLIGHNLLAAGTAAVPPELTAGLRQERETQPMGR
jgi:hypothetical protein